MRKEIMMATLESATKGANIIVGWTRLCKTKKACEDVITKRVKCVGRVGIDYNKQKAVQEKRDSSELPEQAQPIWHGAGEWEIFPFLIRHVRTGQNYLRLYTSTSKTHKPSVEFFRNGIPVTMEEISGDLLASEKKSEKGDCFCCKIEDMTTIEWEPAEKIDDSQPVEVDETTETVKV